MKKNLTALLLLLSSFCFSQISDLTFSKPYFENTLQIINRNITDLECIEEYGYHLGNNELLVFGLSTINTGQHDAAFPIVTDSLGSILPDSVLHEMGLHWDGCHWHIHTDSLYIVVVRDVCYNVVAVGAKIGFNFQDMGNFYRWMQTANGNEDRLYLEQFGVLDWTLSLTVPNDNFNGDTRMGLTRGFYDTYGPQTWGNSVPAAGLQGDYFICVYANYDKYFNQGLNIFPDSSVTPITITPQRIVVRNAHTTACIRCNETNPAPQTITAFESRNFGTRQIEWDSTGACEYTLERLLVRGNSFQTSAVFTVTTNRFYDYAAVPGYFYKYRIGSTISDKVKYK
jgi:hypothetical protein